MMLSGLPSLLGLLGEDRTFFVDERFVELGGRGRFRLHGRDVHGDAFGQVVVAAFDFEQHAALAVVMDIAAGWRVDADDASEPQDFAHLAFDFVFPLLERHALAAGRWLLPEFFWRFRTGAGGELLRQIVGERDELFVLCDGGRLDLQLDHRADAAGSGCIDGHAAFLGRAILRGSTMILLPDSRSVLLRLFEVAAWLPARLSCSPSSEGRFHRAAS